MDPTLSSSHQLDKYLNTFLLSVKRNIYILTVDEQLVPLKLRCSFVTFKPSTLDEYGVKF